MLTTTNWQLLVLIGLVVLTAAGLWLMISGSRGKNRHVSWPEFRIHLGTALLISAITIVLIDIHLQREIESKIDAIPVGVLSYICHNDRGLEQAVNKQIVENEIRYSNFVISATLDAKPQSSPPYAEYNWKREFDVENVGDTPLPWVFHQAVSSDLEVDPQAAIDNSVSIKEVGNDMNLITPQDFLNAYKPDKKSGSADFRKEIILKPKVKYHIQVHCFIHDRLYVGVAEHRTLAIVNGVTYTVNADP